MQTAEYVDRTTRSVAYRTFQATPEEVHEASAELAPYLGWLPLGPSSFSFELAHVGPISVMWGGPVLCVAAYPDGDKTEGRFEVSATLYSWVPQELERAAEAFADAVARHLAFTKGTLTPGHTAEWKRFLKRREWLENLHSKADWTAIVSVVPVGLLIWFTTKNPYYTAGWVMYFTAFILLEVPLRMRAAGMPAKLQLLLFWLIGFPLSVAWTVVMIVAAAGGLPS